MSKRLKFLFLRKKDKKKDAKISIDFKKGITSKKEKQEITTKENQYRKIMYTRKSKKIIRETPGLLKEIKDYLHGLKYRPKVYKVFLNNGETRLKIQEINRPSKNGMLTNNYYVIEIKNKKEEVKFFVKKRKLKKYHINSTGPREMEALNIIKEAGFNVIEPYFAWETKTKESFIFYEYQSKMIDAEKAYLQGKINKEEVSYLRKKLTRLQARLNDFIIKRYPERKVKITDIAPNITKEEHALHLFINFENKKLYLFDPILTNLN